MVLRAEEGSTILCLSPYGKIVSFGYFPFISAHFLGVAGEFPEAAF